MEYFRETELQKMAHELEQVRKIINMFESHMLFHGIRFLDIDRNITTIGESTKAKMKIDDVIEKLIGKPHEILSRK